MTIKNCWLVPQLSDGIDFELADITVEGKKIISVRRRPRRKISTVAA